MGSRGIATLSLTMALGGGGWPMSCRSHFTPWEETRYPFVGGWVGPRARQDRCGKSPPLGFNPRTVQPVASCYTNWAIPAHYYIEYCCISFVLPLTKVKLSKEVALVKVIAVIICVNRWLVNVWQNAGGWSIMAWMLLICHLSPEVRLDLYGSPKMLGSLSKQLLFVL
jgi:hypothetical protein